MDEAGRIDRKELHLQGKGKSDEKGYSTALAAVTLQSVNRKICFRIHAQPFSQQDKKLAEH